MKYLVWSLVVVLHDFMVFTRYMLVFARKAGDSRWFSGVKPPRPRRPKALSWLAFGQPNGLQGANLLIVKRKNSESLGGPRLLLLLLLMICEDLGLIGTVSRHLG